MKLLHPKLLPVLQRLRSLTWVDLFGVCVFLGILSVAFFFFLRKADYAYITLRVSQSDTLNTYSDLPPLWFVEKIQPGLKETDGLGRENILVQGIHRFKSNDLNQDFYVDLKVKSVYNARTEQFTYNGSPLLIGSFQSFKLQSIQLSGVIVDVRGKDSPIDEKTFTLKGFVNPAVNDDQFAVANTVGDGIRNYLADTIQKGQIISDTDGKQIAEILSVEKRQGRRQFVSGREIVSVPDPDRQHVDMTMRVKAIKIGDAYFFRKESPIIVGANLYLSLPQSNVNFTITQIEESK